MLLPHRIAGNLALDFANTVSWRDTARQTDLFGTWEGLRSWAHDAGLTLPPGAASSQQHLSDIRELREAVNDIGSAIAQGIEPPEPATLLLRDVLAGAIGRGCLTGQPLHPEFADQDYLLGSIAWSALQLFGGSELDHIKECPFHDCRWLFVDRSKNRSRRWCDMNTCGNRAKKKAMERT